MEIVIIKGASDTERDRMWVTRSDGSTAQVPINVAHDLPHLVVESRFGLAHGFWGLIDAGAFGDDIRASTARDSGRAKRGRIGVLVGRPEQSPVGPDTVLAQYTEELLAAKAITNAFHMWGASDRTAQGLRDTLAPAAEVSHIVRDVLRRMTDADIHAVYEQRQTLWEQWLDVPPGGQLTLRWPLSP